MRARNEALDCRVYARAAAAICGLDRFTDETWQTLEQHLAALAEQARQGNPAAPPPKPTERPIRYWIDPKQTRDWLKR
jgi:phage terminase large subunit GpA-like protein